MFLVNSRLGHFTATLLALHVVNLLHANGAPLLPKLRGYFAEFLNEGSLERLRILSHLPVSVYGTVTTKLTTRLFLAAWDQPVYGLNSPHRLSELMDSGFCLGISPTRLKPGHPITRLAYPPASPLRSNAAMVVQEY